MKIGHIAIWVNDLEKIREFYVDKFNCTSNAKYINSKKGFSSYFISFKEGAGIELMNSVDISGKDSDKVTGYAHFALNLSNREMVDRLTARLKNQGVVIESEPRLTGDGYYESVIADPEGNLIELVSEE